MKTLFFYDLETTGLNPRADRVMQFAGQRTDLDLQPIGEPYNILVKLSDDILPSPYAIRVTGITPQATLADGIKESDFARILISEVFTPDTVSAGFNNIRFDDEFIRHLLWRNFYDAYEWSWKEDRSRWDLLDLVRLMRALRPEGVNWPVRPDGKETNSLAEITVLNGIEHANAHDALADVNAAIDVARIIRGRQPQLYDYIFKMRDKREVLRLVNLEDKRPFVYASGRYSSEHHKTTVAFPLTAGKNGNIIVYDLRYDPEEVMQRESFYPVVKEFAPNRCPAIAPTNVLDASEGWSKINLTREQIESNLAKLLAHPEFTEQIRTYFESRPDFPPAPDPESALYDSFLGDRDRKTITAIPGKDANALADFHPVFDDPRLPALLTHYKARNFPSSLSETEQAEWDKYRLERLRAATPGFLADLETVARDKSTDPFIVEELRLYYESVAPLE